VKLKSFGLAVAMALALTAVVGVSSASANRFVSPNGGITIWKGEREGSNHAYWLKGEAHGCSTASIAGETNITESVMLTTTPAYSGCTFLGQSLTYRTGGCKYRFHPGPGEALVGKMDIIDCEEFIGYDILGGFCRVEIKNQQGLGPVTYSNSVEGGVEVIKAVAELQTVNYKSLGAGCFQAPGTYYDGTYKGTWKIKGFSTGGSPKPIRVESSPPPSPTKFTAEEAPVKIAGSMAGEKSVFVAQGNGGVICKGHSLSAESATTTSKTITMAGTYSKCSFLGQNATLSMGGCSYVLHPSGGFEITGETCASNPIIFRVDFPGVPVACTVTIGPQSGSTGLTYTNGGSGKLRYVTTGGSSTGLTASAEGAFCLKQGTLEADYRSIDKLTATNSKAEPRGLSVE
jgi:hypothetical protein